MSESMDKATTAVRETAADWVVRWNTGPLTREEESAVFDWLRRSPLHVKEYLRAEAAWLAIDGPARADTTDVHELLRGQPANLIELKSTAFPIRDVVVDTRTLSSRRRAVVAVCAAGAALGVFVLALLLKGAMSEPAYVTSVGELRRVVLEDGSAVDLNTSSKMRVWFSDTARDIYLDRGEAYFEVTKDPRRPFRVISGTAVVRAVGTQFNVYLRSGKTVVTVVEGEVAVASETAENPVSLPAGQAAIIAGHATAPDVAIANTREATAWRQRRLIFNNESLAAVISEFNRYNRQQLVIRDQGLAADRISGVFDANDPQALVRFLAQQSDVQARELSGSRLMLVPAEQ